MSQPLELGAGFVEAPLGVDEELLVFVEPAVPLQVVACSPDTGRQRVLGSLNEMSLSAVTLAASRAEAQVRAAVAVDRRTGRVQRMARGHPNASFAWL